MAKKQITRSGTPTFTEYESAVSSPLFKEIEKFSDSFVETTSSMLERYKKSWVSDPLHQWSRQWEYLYVYEELHKQIKNTKNYKVLDVGSGITFLPYKLAENNNLEVVCSDYDPKLSEQFGEVNETMNEAVQFLEADMRELPIEKESIDIVYCVSVLEHTEQYEQIIKEIHRVLKPGGIFIVTFDISLDGKDDIPVPAAEKLTEELENNFKSKYDTKTIRKSTEATGIVNTADMAKRDKNLLPWKYPVVNSLKPMLSLKKPGKMYKNLTFYCSTYVKE